MCIVHVLRVTGSKIALVVTTCIFYFCLGFSINIVFHLLNFLGGLCVFLYLIVLKFLVYLYVSYCKNE